MVQSCLGQAEPVHVEEQKANLFIQALYSHYEVDHQLLMPAQLAKMSRLLMYKPYLLGALGEGLSGRYDQFPRYRVDAFDCLTFVETVLAMALAHDVDSFKQMIRKIRYQDGQVSFIKRNHFTDLDWNVNNQRQGILQDITPTFRGKNHQVIVKTATANINKPSWYEHFVESRIRLVHARAQEKSERLNELRKRGQSLLSTKAVIPYIPLTALFDAEGKAIYQVFEQIPDGAIIEIIRPNWDLTHAIGTHLNVSHLGFAFWRDGVLQFRNASTLKGQVVDQPLVGYLREALKSPTIKGINVQVVLPR